MGTWTWRVVAVLPYAALFILNVLWLRRPDRPGPLWQHLFILFGLAVLAIVTVRRWKREGTASPEDKRL